MTLSGEKKIKSRDEIAKIIAGERQRGTPVGFTSGVFDLLHSGHVDYLERARLKCGLLVAGVNSDSSVRSNKGPSRPISSQEERCQVLSALECVNYVFVFEEKNNNKNIEVLRPDIYFKAGDYTSQKLSSAPIIESYGGRVEIIPMTEGQSSSGIIDRILGAHIGDVHATNPQEIVEMRPAVFLDRDGTVIEHVEYLHEPGKIKFFPDAVEGMKRLFDAGYRIIIITNQPGIGFGYFSKEDFFLVSRHMLKSFGKAGVLIDKIYYCPHTEAENCRCRKPATGLIERAVEELKVDLGRSFVVGDMTSDVMLGRNSGTRSILVQTGQGGRDGRFAVQPDFAARDLGHAAEWILSAFSHPKDTPPVVCAPHAPRPLGQESLEAMGRLGGKVGHDLNNFLCSLRGCLDMVKRKMNEAFPKGSPVERQISVMESSVARMTDLAEKIRGFARPGSVETVETKVEQAIAAAVRFLIDQGIDPIVEVRADLTVSMHEFSMQQVLLALCWNAIDAMKEIPDKSVVVLIDKTDAAPGLKGGSFCRVSVIDHGKGIDADQEKKVFTPFFSTKAPTPGQAYGLSLSMAREIVRKHGGTIALKSQVKCGTAVSIYLPVRA